MQFVDEAKKESEGTLQIGGEPNQKSENLLRNATFLGIVALVLIIWACIPNSLVQYFFFLRVPILTGLLLLTLPPIAIFGLPALLKNLFVLRDIWQLACVIISAIVAGMAIVLVVNTLLCNAPARFDLPPWPTIPDFWLYALAILSGLPTCIAAVYLTVKECELKNEETLIGVIFGAIGSIGLLSAVDRARDWLSSQAWLEHILGKIAFFFNFKRPEGYIDPETGELLGGHLSVLAFLLVALSVYFAIYLAYKPRLEEERESNNTPQGEQKQAPALLYLMSIVSILTLFLGGAAFYFDYFRIPVLLFLIIVSGFTYFYFEVDHFYELKVIDDPNSLDRPKSNDFKTVLNLRLQHQKEDKTLVVVCASGGGIQAAGWTVRVLSGLQEAIGEEFSKAIGLISSVSGGSVGTMYYLDRFGNGAVPENELPGIFDSATRDSLDAVGWGLAYPDLWRSIGLPFLAPKNLDRGTAIEIDWKREMKSPQTSLLTWRERIFKGEIPIPIFNATLVEDGRRFLISPMSFTGKSEGKSIDFNSLFPDSDMNAVAAARLSATFPYVSPIARNCHLNGENRTYHVADGGYFDNSGFVTALEWLNEWLEVFEKELDIKKVLLLQINAFSQSPAREETRGNRGWFMATLGPFLAVFKVRDQILTTRNATEVEMLKRQWESRVKIEYFNIFFPSDSNFFNRKGQYRPPLSWKLTKKEKQAIADAWNQIRDEVVEKIGKHFPNAAR